MKLFILIIAVVYSSFTQSKIAGSVTLESAYTSYSEESNIWSEEAYNNVVSANSLDPAIYNFDNYSRAIVVPGLREKLNLSLFYFAKNYKIAFYSKITNSEWLTPNELRYIDRVSLSASFGKQKITVGDNYINSASYFIANRRLRGISADLNFLNDNPNYGINLKAFSGISEFKTDVGDPVTSRYQSFYTINRYQRSFSGAEVNSSIYDDLLELKIAFLTGEDKAEGDISEFTTKPLVNSVAGGSFKFNFINKQVHIFGDFYSSNKDSVFTTHSSEGESKRSSRYGLGLETKQVKLNFALYSIDPDYYTFGQPYLINDRKGFQANGSLNFSEKLNVGAKIDFYDTNIDENPELATLSNRQLDFNIGLPISKKLNVFSNYLRLTDSGSGENITVHRISNTVSLGAAYLFDKAQVSISAGTSSATDNSVYGFIEGEAIRGINSSRNFFSLSGYYNFSKNLVSTLSLNTNIIKQESVDETTITTALMSSTYSMPENGLKFVLLGQFNYSNNELSNALLLQELSEATTARYNLFSAINKYTNNFVDLTTEYLFSYSIRAKLGLRYESKQYRYLEDQFTNSQSIIDEMIKLNNPNFLKQRESFSAMVYTIGLSYLL